MFYDLPYPLELDDNKLLQYSRQILLPQIGIVGQQALLKSRVLLIGLGGLGSPVAMYLASAGIGKLTLVDFDKVELSNLQRQVIHDQDSIGQSKVESARRRLNKLAPDCKVHCVDQLLDESELSNLLAEHDLCIDATDNFNTRFMINRCCVRTQKPLVSGAAIRWEGQVISFSNQPGSACYNCLYSESGADDETCTANGVLAPVVGIIGSIQATEAIKLLTGAGEPLDGRLLIMDALSMSWRTINIKPDPNCEICQHVQS